MIESDAQSIVSTHPRAPKVFLLGASPSLTNGEMSSAAQSSVEGTAARRLQATGQNTGNQVIAYGLLKTVNFKTVNWNTSIGPKRVTEEYDLILIAAANFLHTAFDFAQMADFIEATDLPVTMVGVGAQSKDYSTDIRLMPGTDRLMRIVAERSCLIGARGPFTADVLAKMGIHNVQVTGCPSYYMSCKPQFTVRKQPLRPDSRFLMNSSRDVVSHSFDRERMVSIVCALLRTAMEKNADFVPQSELPEISIADSKDTAEIERCIGEILRSFPAYKQIAPHDELTSWFTHHMRVFWDVGAWREAMKAYDFVFGNRFHGNMVALLAGTPACVICHDTRTSEMCEFLRLPYVGMQDLDDIDVESLYDKVDPDAIQARYAQLYPQYKKFLTINGIATTLE